MNTSVNLIKAIIEIAEKSSKAYKVYHKKYFPSGIMVLGEDMHRDTIEYAVYNTYEDSLFSLLINLDYEEILDIEALMLHGRDGDGFNVIRDDLKETFPNENGKTQAIEYIMEKGPLSKYLADGLEKLGLD